MAISANQSKKGNFLTHTLLFIKNKNICSNLPFTEIYAHWNVKALHPILILLCRCSKLSLLFDFYLFLDLAYL